MLHLKLSLNKKIRFTQSCQNACNWVLISLKKKQEKISGWKCTTLHTNECDISYLQIITFRLLPSICDRLVQTNYCTWYKIQRRLSETCLLLNVFANLYDLPTNSKLYKPIYLCHHPSQVFYGETQLQQIQRAF